MTILEQEELLALVAALPERDRRALLDALRKLPPGHALPPWLWPDGPLPADEADAMRRSIEHHFGQPEDEALGWIASAFDRVSGHER